MMGFDVGALVIPGWVAGLCFEQFEAPAVLVQNQPVALVVVVQTYVEHYSQVADP